VNDVPERLLQLIYFMLPAYAANMAPPFAKYWPGWNTPIAARELGTHKTVIGFAFGVVAAVLVAGIQSRISWTGVIVDYDDWLALGLRFGIGAMGGDSLKSLVKRRLGIPPGAPWRPFDQLDFVVGALVLVGSMVRLAAVDYGLILALTGAGHIVTNQVAYALGIRDTRW
jgi:CDP-2,3-bis-(O-geranylgeranyl)-sn-glycerol synthase